MNLQNRSFHLNLQSPKLLMNLMYLMNP